MNVKDLMLNIISPPKCISCNHGMSLSTSSKVVFCSECGKTCRKIGKPTCNVCGKPILENADNICVDCKAIKTYYIRNVSRYIYKGCVKDAIRNMKFKKREWIAFEFGRLLSETVSEYYGDIDFDMILYVPMTGFDKSQRGFNQSCEMAEIISQKLKIPIVHDVLRKRINVKTQSGLTREERFKNVKNMFFLINANKIVDKTILLIDDVRTTGATLNECSRVLKKAGATAIYTATVAITAYNE